MCNYLYPFSRFRPVQNDLWRILIRKSFLLLLFILTANRTFAWVYPEHRDIAIIAIKHLSPEYRSIMDKMWSRARMGYSERLTESVINTSQTVKPTQLDFASWTAISGDHSCSPEDMLHNVLKTGWIMNVADIAAQLKIDFKNAKKRSQYINAIRDSDI